jgi:hypothetical protein
VIAPLIARCARVSARLAIPGLIAAGAPLILPRFKEEAAVRLLIGVLLSIALGPVTYAALALTNESISYDSQSRPRLAQADAAQSEQARSLRAESDAVSLLTKRVALLEQRVDALEAKSRSATTSTMPRAGPRGWIAY